MNSSTNSQIWSRHRVSIGTEFCRAERRPIEEVYCNLPTLDDAVAIVMAAHEDINAHAVSAVSGDR